MSNDGVFVGGESAALPTLTEELEVAHRAMFELEGFLRHWRDRAIAAEETLRRRPGTVILMRCDDGRRPRADRIHSFARLEAENGDTIIIDPESLRIACVVAGVELKR